MFEEKGEFPEKTEEKVKQIMEPKEQQLFTLVEKAQQTRADFAERLGDQLDTNPENEKESYEQGIIDGMNMILQPLEAYINDKEAFEQ
ncbi:hypothetical protein J2S09_005062 [Bacillus fengqiuensis]|nr:hypothetical protein [Bacillus fengqiuensis]